MNTEILKIQGLENNTIDRILSMLDSTFGNKSNVKGIEHIGGGVAKTTFKIMIKNHGDFLLQIWKEPEHGLTSVFGLDVEQLWPVGLDRVIKNTLFLESLDVRVPKIIASSFSDVDAPGVAIIEYIEGRPFVEMNKDELSDITYSKIGELVGKIHSNTSAKPGIADENSKATFDCLELVHSVALKELAIACEYDSFAKNIRSRILEALDILRSQASHRQIYNLIHGDGLQMLISRYNEPVLIDIDAMQYFDLEYEYCIMDLPHINFISCPAFMDSYKKLIIPNCDFNRLQYYRICKLISWLSYFAEPMQKTDSTKLEVRYKNTRQWLRNALEKIKQ